MSSNAEAEPTWPSTSGSLGKGNDKPDNPGIPAASGAVEAQPSSTLIDKDKEHCCKICKAEKNGRKLIVALDGTLNQFGRKNSNVVEIYARIEKDGQQLSYYNSGIGTYANTARSTIWKRTKLKLSSLFDMAFARNFEKIVLGAYRWLSDTYQPGDQIFLFGFSRGAYQVRVLAGMIEQVGLIYSGNEEQIPFAYQLYEQADDSMANHFKETFSHREVKVHFLGVWDTVSSVGVFGRKKDLPRTRSCDHVCHVRHALALDERRVKFNPEFFEPSTKDALRGHLSSSVGQSRNLQTDRMNSSERDGVYTHLKEVWFAGCHSDVGGGNRPKDKLLMEDIPALWMANEARTAGLKFKPTKVGWNMEQLKHETPIESLTPSWWILELLPFLRHSESLPHLAQSEDLPWWSYARLIHWLHRVAPHCGEHRYIRPDQKIHASVTLTIGYTPRARFIFSRDATCTWDRILGKDHINELSHFEKRIEFDLYDISSAVSLVQALEYTNEPELQSALDRLLALAEFEAGVAAIIWADRGHRTLKSLIKRELTDEVKAKAVELVFRIGIQRSNDPQSQQYRPQLNLLLLWRAGFKDVLMPLALAESDKLSQVKRTILLLYLPDPLWVDHPYDSSILKFAIDCLSTDAADIAIATLLTLHKVNPHLVEQEVWKFVGDTPAESTVNSFNSGIVSILEKLPAYMRVSALQLMEHARGSSLYGHVNILNSTEIANALINLINLSQKDILYSAARLFPQFVALCKNPGVKPGGKGYHWWCTLSRWQLGGGHNRTVFSNGVQFLKGLAKHSGQDTVTDFTNFVLSPDAVLSRQSIDSFKQTAGIQGLRELICWVKQYGTAESFTPHYLTWLQKAFQGEADLLHRSTLHAISQTAMSKSPGCKIVTDNASVAGAFAEYLNSNDQQTKTWAIKELRNFEAPLVKNYHHNVQSLAHRKAGGSFEKEVLDCGIINLLLKLIRNGEQLVIHLPVLSLMISNAKLRHRMVEHKIIEEVAQHVRHGGGIKIIALEFLADLAQYGL
ncbi:predicted protein [Sparassis crispa]|uniref:T6SS Phospholipase effector Tle1-like catalytic domain-containing protein n=1 Tax=Sparassis crispa TaxID=139825 RepID=A0A401GYK3_9APHY|nr:predicted protein [Sparassis crispa]GBE87239.1 predicted protein [Sparassis crispa]